VTALWIIGGIVLFIMLIMMISITVYVKIDETVRVKVGALGIRFTVFPAREEKPPQAKKKKGKLAKPQKAPPEKKANERSFGDAIAFAVSILQAVVPGAVRIVRKIRITRMRIFLSVGAEDADTAAVRYGQTCMGVYSLLACANKAMTLKVKDISIAPDFVTGQMRYDISFCAKLRIGRAVLSALGILFKLIAVFVRQSKRPAAALPAHPAPKKPGGKQKERVESV